MHSRALGIVVVVAGVAGGAGTASAKTWQVGPAREYTQLSQVAEVVQPGDVVEVDGDAEYGPVDFNVDGTAAAPITIRGLPVNGKRPVVRGGDYTVMLRGNHTVFEGFEVTGGTEVCVLHKAHGVVIRDAVIHDCVNHGVLGTDYESGDLTLEYSEIYRNGNGDRKHQVYIATDEGMWPGAVFRLQHCYIHDATGGNSVKSRSERNEIYYNWIEGAMYHELDLIGSQEYATDVAEENSDVVGNVFIKVGEWDVARIGGDGTGETYGKYRFVNNTFVLDGADEAIRAQLGIESIELHNNVFVRFDGAPMTIVRESEVSWESGAMTVFGTNNWVPAGATLPGGLEGTVEGGDPGLVDLAALDVRPKEGSVLVDAASGNPPPFAGHVLPDPLIIPLELPYGGLKPAGEPMPRPAAGAGLDIGAFEIGSGPPLQPPGGGGGGGGGGGDDDGVGDNEGGCSVSPGGERGVGGAFGLAVGLLVGFALRRALRARRRRRA
jgi:hypothetical protein